MNKTDIPADSGIELEVLSATSVPAYIPFTTLPKSWAGRKVIIMLSEDDAITPTPAVQPN